MGDRQPQSLRTMEKLVEMMQLQLQQQREETQAQEQRFHAQADSQEQRFREHAERQQADMKAMLHLLTKPTQSGQVLQPATYSATPAFSRFDSTSELWKDYWSQFLTFTRAHAVPDGRKAMGFFLTKFFSRTSRRRCISFFQTLLHKKRRRGKSTISR